MLGNSLTISASIPDSLKFDLILIDPPMGVLDRKSEGTLWDYRIDFPVVFRNMEKILQKSGVMVIFSHISLISIWMAEIQRVYPKGYSYVIYWDKSQNFTKISSNVYCKYT